MTEKYLSIVQFEDIMQGWIVDVLQWGEAYMSPSKENDVRITWPTEGQPAPLITEDIVYLRCYEIDDQYNRKRDVDDIWESSPGENFVRQISYTRVWQLDLIVYGPNSFEVAQEIRHRIFLPENLLIINKNNLYLVPDVPAPKRVPEYFQGRWWERTDMYLQFNELVVRESTVPAIESIEVGVYEGEEGKCIAEIKTE